MTGLHVAVFGVNGTGKTTWARGVIRDTRACWVLDTKGVGDFDVLGWPTVYDVTALRAIDRAIYRPPLGAGYRDLEPFFSEVYRRGWVKVLVDEATHVCSASAISRGYVGLLRSGRGRGVQVVTLAQRAVGLHNDVMSESWTYVLFRLGGDPDAQKLQSFGVSEEATKEASGLPPYRYLVWDRMSEEVSRHATQAAALGSRDTATRRRGKDGRWLPSGPQAD